MNILHGTAVWIQTMPVLEISQHNLGFIVKLLLMYFN